MSASRRVTKGGRPRRGWRNVTAKDPLKPRLVALLREGWRRQNPEEADFSLRITRVRVRDGVQPILAEGHVLVRMDMEGRTLWDDTGALAIHLVRLGPTPDDLILAKTGGVERRLRETR